jgi:hypothetical protein
MQEVIIKSTMTDATSETQAPKTSKAARRLPFLKSVFSPIDGCLCGSKGFTRSVY